MSMQQQQQPPPLDMAPPANPNNNYGDYGSQTVETCEDATALMSETFDGYYIQWNDYGAVCDTEGIPAAEDCMDQAEEAFGQIEDYYNAISRYGADFQALSACYDSIDFCMTADESVDGYAETCMCEGVDSVTDCNYYQCNRIVLYYFNALDESPPEDRDSELDADKDCSGYSAFADCFAYDAGLTLADAKASCDAAWDAQCVTTRDYLWQAFDATCAAFDKYLGTCDAAGSLGLKDTENIVKTFCVEDENVPGSCDAAASAMQYCFGDQTLGDTEGGVASDAKDDCIGDNCSSGKKTSSVKTMAVADVTAFLKQDSVRLNDMPRFNEKAASPLTAVEGDIGGWSGASVLLAASAGFAVGAVAMAAASHRNAPGYEKIPEACSDA